MVFKLVSFFLFIYSCGDGSSRLGPNFVQGQVTVLNVLISIMTNVLILDIGTIVVGFGEGICRQTTCDF